MKKFTLVFSALLTAGFLFSQTLMQPVSGYGFHKTPLNLKSSFIGKNSRLASGAPVSYWLNYSVSADYAAGWSGPPANPVSALFSEYLFWDSLPKVNYNGTYAHIAVENIGQVLDVNSQIFTQDPNLTGYNLNANSAYSVDSMAIDYIYTRQSASAVIDTLVIQLYVDNKSNAASGNLPVYLFNFTSEPNDYYTDTVYFKAQKYTYSTNKANATPVYTYTVGLASTDSSSVNIATKGFALPVPFQVPAGNMLAAAITFKAGYSYKLNDTLKNPFSFISAEQNGDAGGTGTYENYLVCNPSKANLPCDWNVSSIVRSTERYNKSGNSWDGFFVPTYSFNLGYPYQNHSIYYHVTQTNLGIAQNTPEILKVNQNSPNPFSDNTLINYELAENSAVNLDIYDITGKKVQQLTEGLQSAGAHSLQVNAANLQSGIYFYTLTAGENRVTRKMSIIK